MLFSGNVKNQVKMMELKHNWQQKKKDPASLAPQSLTEAKSSEQAMLEKFMEQPKYSAGVLDAKLSTGKKLTPAEMEYLRGEHPALYAKAQRIQAERAQYERELKRCRTKEEARSLRMSRAAVHVDDVRAAAQAGDASGATETHQRSVAVTEEHIRFTGSRRYRALPENYAELAARRRQRRNKAGGAAGAGTTVVFYDAATRTRAVNEAMRRQIAALPKDPRQQYEEGLKGYQRQEENREEAAAAHKKKRIRGNA